MLNDLIISSFEDELEKISYNIGYSALGGGLAGAGAGWLSRKDGDAGAKGGGLDRALIGAGIGAVGGAGAHLGLRRVHKATRKATRKAKSFVSKLSDVVEDMKLQREAGNDVSFSDYYFE